EERLFCFPGASRLCSSLLPVNLLIGLFSFDVAISSGVAGCVFDLAHGIAGFTLDLTLQAFSLHFLVPGPLARLPLVAASNIFHLSFNAVFVHELPSTNWSVLTRCPSAGNELEDQRDQRQHQQQVNESTHGVTTYNSQQPQHEQNYK